MVNFNKRPFCFPASTLLLKKETLIMELGKHIEKICKTTTFVFSFYSRIADRTEQRVNVVFMKDSWNHKGVILPEGVVSKILVLNFHVFRICNFQQLNCGSWPAFCTSQMTSLVQGLFMHLRLKKHVCLYNMERQINLALIHSTLLE